jgi:hypothetical protein
MLVLGYAANEGSYDVVEEEGVVDEEFTGFRRWLGRSARVSEGRLEAPSTGHADQVISREQLRSKWSVPDFIDTGLGCQIG